MTDFLESRDSSNEKHNSASSLLIHGKRIDHRRWIIVHAIEAHDPPVFLMLQEKIGHFHLNSRIILRVLTKPQFTRFFLTINRSDLRQLDKLLQTLDLIFEGLLNIFVTKVVIEIGYALLVPKAGGLAIMEA